MASSGPSVSVKQNDAGDYVLGATIDRTFIPFSTVSKVHVEAQVEKAKSLKSKSGDDEEEEG